MKDLKIQLTEEENNLIDMLYQELEHLPTQYLLDRIDDHDCGLDYRGACECISFVRELDRRMNKESVIL
jgi:hypothetical protein